MSEIYVQGASSAGEYREWRVTGVPTTGGEPYSFVWSPLLREGDAEQAARSFVAMIREAPEKWPRARQPWHDGPHLSSRMVTISEWQPADGAS